MIATGFLGLALVYLGTSIANATADGGVASLEVRQLGQVQSDAGGPTAQGRALAGPRDDNSIDSEPSHSDQEPQQRAAGSHSDRPVPSPGNHSQADALADGIVTRAEYDAAIAEVLDCVEAAGAEIEGLRYEDYRNVPVWRFVVRNVHDFSPEDLTPYDECWINLSRDVESAWAEQLESRVPDTKRAADEAAALSCASEEGLGVDTVAELRDLFTAHPGDNSDGVARCFLIAAKGYDMDDHSPIGAPSE